MADEGAEAPTVFPKIDYYFVFQTAASDFSNQHDKISKTLICEWLLNMDPRDASASKNTKFPEKTSQISKEEVKNVRYDKQL